MIALQLIRELDRFGLNVGYANDTSRAITIRDVTEADGRNEIVYALSVDIRHVIVCDIYVDYELIKSYFSVTRTFPELTGDTMGIGHSPFPEHKHCRGYFTGTASVSFSRAVGLLSDGNLMYSYNLIIRSNKIGY